MRQSHSGRSVLAVLPAAALALLVGAGGSLLGVCGPFTDVAADSFCPFVLEVFYLGITTGVTPTTYDPAGNVTRLQMAAFLSRTVDRVLQRGGHRAAMKRFWTPQNGTVLGLTTIADDPLFVEVDGSDVWVSHNTPGVVSRVRAGDGRLLETWTGATFATGVLAAMGKILVAGGTNPGRLYRIDPSQPAGAVTTVASTLGIASSSVAFDGTHIWTANGGSVSIITPAASIPWSAANVTVGFTSPAGLVFDGANMWVTNIGPGTLLKLDQAGAILQTVTVGAFPLFPVFDGTNIWVPNHDSNSVSVVRASNGAVLATLTANGLNSPGTASFDGQRVLVTNTLNTNSVSIWKAADLTALGSVSLGPGTNPVSAASDGINFWLVLNASNQLARF